MQVVEAEKRKFSGGDEERSDGDEGVVEKKQAVSDRPDEKLSESSISANFPITETMECPINRVSAIIGTKGAIVSEIMRRSTCKVNINQEVPDNEPRIINIFGLPDGIAAAKELCSRIIEGGATVLQNPIMLLTGPDTADSMQCAEDKVRIIIGAKGSVVNELMRRTGARITINQDMDKGLPRIINITGKKVQVLEAKALISNILVNGLQSVGMQTIPGVTPNGGMPSIPNSAVFPNGNPAQYGAMNQSAVPNIIANPTGEGIVVASHYNQAVLAAQQMGQAAAITTSEMDVAHDKVSLVIGAKGVVISQIMKLSGCRITILQENLREGQPRKAHFTGTAQQIGSAMVLMSSVINSGPDVVMKGHNALLAQNAQNPLHVVNPSAPKNNYGGMQPDGLRPPAPVNTVIQEITMLQSQLSKLISNPSGDVIKRLQHVCDVSMNVINDTNNSEQKIVKIVGERGQVQAALNAILQVFQYGIDPNTIIANLSAARGIPPPQPLPQVPIAPMGNPSSGPNNVLALGADGTSGYLYEKTILPDGYFQQLALVKRSMCGRVVGKNGINLTLLKNKSGAIVSAEKCNNMVKVNEPDELSKVTVIGSEKAVQLCAQMLQEIISNGHKRIVEMPDAPFSLPMGYAPPMNPMDGGRGGYHQGPQFNQNMQQNGGNMYGHPPPNYGMNGGNPNPNMMQNNGFNQQQYYQGPPQQMQQPPPQQMQQQQRFPPGAPVDNSYPNIARINLNSQGAPPQQRFPGQY